MKNALALTSTRQSLPASPIDHFRQLQPATHTDVFRSETPALSVVKNQAGEQTAATYVTAMLSDIEQFYNVKQSLSAIQLRMLAEMILKNYYYFKVADLKLFAEKFKLGLYGKVYDRIDGGVIMEALNQYNNERMNEAEQFSQKKSSKFKAAGIRAADKIMAAIIDGLQGKSIEKKVSPVFISVAQYCEHYGLDKSEVGRKLAQAVSEDYDRAALDMDYDEYTQYWMNQWLYDKTVEARNR